MEVVPRKRTRNRDFEFEIRWLEFHGAHYQFTANEGSLKVDRRNGWIAASMQVVLHIQPNPAGGSIEGTDVEFNGYCSLRHFSRYPPNLGSVAIVGPERPRPFQLRLSIFAEPAG